MPHIAAEYPDGIPDDEFKDIIYKIRLHWTRWGW